MVRDPLLSPARYDWFGWSVEATPVDAQSGRLAETHEYFHRQLDDTTAFGSLTTTAAALAAALPSSEWPDTRDRLQDMSDLVHESFAVGLSLLTTQRPLEPIAGYPAYDRHLRTVNRLLGPGVHPWVALAALRAAATACMQSSALRRVARDGIETFDVSGIPRGERPNHRLAALLAGGYRDRVADAQRARNRSTETSHGGSRAAPSCFPPKQWTVRPQTLRLVYTTRCSMRP